jgi:hypothetical protein
MTDNQRIRRAPHNKENPFAQISREMLQDKTMSYEARGLLSYLLSKSGDWEARVGDLQIDGAGRDKVYRIISELQQKGYISQRQKYQDEKGQWQWTPYDVHEKPCPEKPYTDDPYTENTEIYKKQKNDIQNTKEREKKKKKEFAPVGAGADVPLQSDPRALLEDANPFAHLSQAEFDALSGEQVVDALNEMLPLEGKNSTRKENSTRKPTKTTATTPIPPTPLSAAPRKQSALQAENAALVDALGEAWGIKATPADYSLYVKKAQKLVSSIPVEKFKAFCDRQKAKAGDYADKLTIATITENGRISEFVQWEQNERAKAEKRARDEEKFFQAYPDQRPGYVPESGYASPEKVEALRNLLRSRGQYSD